MPSKLLELLTGRLRALHGRRARSLFAAGIAQQQAGDHDGARRCFEQALALDPQHAGAHHRLGIMLVQSRSYADSARHLERAMTLDPYLEGGWVDLGNVHYWLGDYRKACASFRAALAAAPDSVPALANLGLVLKEAGQVDEALVHLRRARELAPEAEAPLRNLMLALIDSDRCDEAFDIATKALERDPARYEAHFFFGLACHQLLDPAQALVRYDAAMKLRPGQAELYRNRGLALQELGRLPEAIEDYERALALQPEYPLARLNLALARLLVGDYERGWEEYEARRSSEDYPRRDARFPSWDGAPLAGRTLLVFSEQGLGDEIMFASCLPQLIERAGHCIVECGPKLLKLFSRSFPAATVYAATPDRSLPREIAARDIDVEIAAGSLPRFFRRNLNDFPRHDGYLRAEPGRIACWRERLAQLGPGLKVGISWTGGVHKTRRPLRSVPLEQWLPILETPQVRFVSLQYTAEAGTEVAELRAQHGVMIEHWPEAIDDYHETAALVCALDLVISVCTAIVHLGGALGRPVWVMAPHSPEWRYGLKGDTMPWYPFVKIIRQPAFGEWGPVVFSVATELRRRAGAAAGSGR